MNLSHWHHAIREAHNYHDEAYHESQRILKQDESSSERSQKYLIGDFELKPEIGCMHFALNDFKNADAKEG